MESDIYDDSQSDSGLSADFSPCGTLDTPTTDTDTAAGPPAGGETPIEKEIRRAVEREGSLRRSRGLQVAAAAPQYVEIPLRRSVLGGQAPPPAKSERNQGKDRHYAGKKMQREIHADTQREQDLVKIGTVSGGYDRGTVRQLRERQKLFEVFQEAAGPSLTLSGRSKAPSPWLTSPGDLSVPENRGDGSSAASTPRGSFSERRRSSDLLTPGPSPMLGPGFSEGADCQVIILESNDVRLYYSGPPGRHAHGGSDIVDGALDPPSSSSLAGEYEGDLIGSEEEEEQEEEEEEAAAAPPRENPFFKLRSSAAALDKVGRDIREAQDRERDLRKQRGCLYGGGGGGGGRGASRGGDVTPVSTAPPPPPPPPLLLNGLAPPDPPVLSSRRATGPSTAARQSLCRLGVMWPPAHTEDQQLVWPESPPWTPRQRTPLLQRWELGLVNGHGDGDGDREEDN